MLVLVAASSDFMSFAFHLSRINPEQAAQWRESDDLGDNVMSDVCTLYDDVEQHRFTCYVK